MLATGNEDEKQKTVAVFLTVIGAKTYSLLRDLVHPDKPATKTYGQLIAKIGTSIVIAERFKFHARVQHQGETVANFLAGLRKLSEHCQFGAFREEALRQWRRYGGPLQNFGAWSQSSSRRSFTL